jgi:hypothetical protein
MLAVQKKDNELFYRSKASSASSKTPRKNKMRLVYRAPTQSSESDHDEIIESDHDETLEGMPVTEEEYWDQYYTDTPYEWNDGILEVKPLSDYRSNLLQIFFEDLIREYRNLGIKFQQIKCEIGFKMLLKKGKKIRKPDIGFVGPDSLEMEELDCSYKGIFDLCVEFLSDSKPSEVKRDIQEKYKEYEEAGVKEYFILDRNETHTAFYRLNNGRYEPIKTSDGIVRSEVLKQFQFRIQHLYSRPDLNELIDDPVYQHYVKIDYQKEKKRADLTERLVEQEKARAEQEKARAEQEKARAEDYRQKLIALGISI